MKLRTFLILTACLMFAGRASPSVATGQETQIPRDEGLTVIKTEVNLITFEMFVEDKKGKPVNDLKPENVRITICKTERSGEEKKAKGVEICELQETAHMEQINRPRIEANIIIDTSMSSALFLESITKKAVPNLVASIGRIGDTYNFFEYVQTMNPLGEVKISADKTPEDIAKEVSNILDPLEAKSYGSKIFSSIYLAIKDPRYGFAKSSKEDVFKLIIIVTDGFDYSDDPLIREARMTFEGSNYEENVSLLCPEEERMRKIGGCREVRKEDIISALEEEGVTLYVVDYSKKMREPLATFTPMNDPNNLGEITDATGGRRILASNDREVRSAFEKITETISRTYVVYFYPTEGFTGINRYDRRVEIGYIDKNDEFKKYDYRIYTAERYVVR